MIQYSDYEFSSISMSKDEVFIKTLVKLLSSNKIDFIFETGTFKGDGSTKTIIENFPSGFLPKRFITIEANPIYVRIARENLKKHAFVEVVYGSTVSIEEGMNFIINNNCIKNHENFPKVFIDTLVNPTEFYINELKGKLGNHSLKSKFFSVVLNLFYRKQDSVLEKYLKPMKYKKPLIILDSAGGIGYLEFKKVINIMGNNPYWLVLDDIHHLKHFQSIEYVKNNNDFRIIGMSNIHGWSIIEHIPLL
jgi:hypothetical protein